MTDFLSLQTQLASLSLKAPEFRTNMVTAWNFDSFKEYVRRGGNINVDDEEHKSLNYSPLIRAITTLMKEPQAPEMIEWMLEHGANPNYTTSFGITPLHHVCWNFYPEPNYYAVIRLLLEKGADSNAIPTAECYKQKTPLHFLVRRRKYVYIPDFSEVLRLFLKQGANPNLYDTKDRTVLDMQEYLTKAEIAILLLKN